MEQGQMERTVKKFLDWFRLHPWIATSFFVGVGAGVILCMPLIPYTLPDSHSSLIGSAVGAFVAVWGAAWVADGKARRSAALARRAIGQEVAPFIEALSDFLAAASNANDGDAVALDDATRRLKLMPSSFEGFEEWLQAAEPLFREAGAAGMSSYPAMKLSTSLIFQLLRGNIDECFVLENEYKFKHHRNSLRNAMNQL